MAIVTINLTPEALELSRIMRKEKQFSRFVCEVVCKQMTDKERLIAKRKKLEEDVNNINKQIKLLEKYEAKKLKEQSKIMSQPEVDFWKETIDVIGKDPTFLEGRKNLYNNNFNNSCSTVEFMQILENIKEKLNV